MKVKSRKRQRKEYRQWLKRQAEWHMAIDKFMAPFWGNISIPRQNV